MDQEPLEHKKELTLKELFELYRKTEEGMSVADLNQLTVAMTPGVEKIVQIESRQLERRLTARLHEQDKDLARKFLRHEQDMQEIKKLLIEVRGGKTFRMIIKYAALISIAIIGLIAKGEFKWPSKN
jgi:hypothetical protein